MSNTPHELHEEFPGQAELLSSLKATDAHFAKLAEAYHEVNRDIHRAETNVEPADDMHIIQLRKERGLLKDQIAALLRAAATA